MTHKEGETTKEVLLIVINKITQEEYTMIDNRYKDADGTLVNPECDGHTIGNNCVAGEVRLFKTSGMLYMILCRACTHLHKREWTLGKPYKNNEGKLL